ncbi:PAS domain-containing protein [bacterium]|nr:PAS domain-containing protein [bacterium]
MVIEKSRSEAIITSLPEGIILTDMDNRLVLANPHAEKILNCTADRVQGRHILDVITNESVTEHIKNGGNSVSREVSIPTSGRRTRIYQLTSTLVRNDTGSSIGIISVLRDITRDRELEELRDGFLRTVSHELRTPLTSIIGFIELVAQGTSGPITAKQSEFLKIALNEANGLKHLIDDLLDLSRMSAGKISLTYSPVSMLELARSVVTTLSPLAKSKTLSLSVTPTSTAGIMDSDAAKIRQILMNLVTNAIKFTPSGSITIAISETHDHVSIEVSDTGIGLREEELGIIFERFRQVDYSSTRQFEGIGLGLSIVKQLTELLNGTISVESTYGSGSRFTVTLPRERKRNVDT